MRKIMPFLILIGYLSLLTANATSTMYTNLDLAFVRNYVSNKKYLQVSLESVSKTVNIIRAGTLDSLLTTEEKSTIRKLIIVGNIDVRDFYTMRNMIPYLSDLDISSVSIQPYSAPDDTTNYQANQIPAWAFYGCDSLINIEMGSSVTSIASGAFIYSSIASITISKELTSINHDAFSNCYNLAQFIVDADNPVFSSIDGVLFNKTQTRLIIYPSGRRGGYAVPRSVISIGDWAFAGCIRLNGVEFGDSLITIGNKAFSGCTNLPGVEIGYPIISIGSFAFEDCSGLTSLNISNSVQSIGNYAFDYCVGLTGSLLIPNSVVTIGDRAFYNCNKITDLTIGKSVTSIGNWAFSWCTGLRKLTVLSGVPPIINEYTFTNMDMSICTLYVPIGTLPTYNADPNWNNFTIIRDVTVAKSIYYVKANGVGNGNTWATASGNIQTMINKALVGDEIWIAKGVYYPTVEMESRVPRSRTFLLKDGVNMYGGFEGSELAINERALSDMDGNGIIESSEFSNTTILSGNIDGVEDVWTKTLNANGFTWQWSISGNEGNCYRVVSSAADFSYQSSFDGFTVLGGNSNDPNNNYVNGAGLYIQGGVLVKNCTISNCFANNSGGGIYAYFPITASQKVSSISNCVITDCSAKTSGGGIYANSDTQDYYSNLSVFRTKVSNCSSNTGGGMSLRAVFYYSFPKAYYCVVDNCSASLYGGGIFSDSQTEINNCIITNCSSGDQGGGIYSSTNIDNQGIYSFINSCLVTNCSSVNQGGGIYAAAQSYNTNVYITNCAVMNCESNLINGGGLFSLNNHSYVNYCFVNNNLAANVSSNIFGGTLENNLSSSLIDCFIKPSSFVGIAKTNEQKTESLLSDWHLREGSPCINGGNINTTSDTSSITGVDYDGKKRILYGIIDIGAYEYVMPTISIPVMETFNNWTDFENSNVFFNSSTINGNKNFKWVIENNKAIFSWKTNLTTPYSRSIFSYGIDATKADNVYLIYDMYYEAYSGTIAQKGTEKMSVEVSNDMIIWTPVSTYSNLNGTIANRTYSHDISSSVVGKTFFVRFTASGLNANNIEKWELDNIRINLDGSTGLSYKMGRIMQFVTNNGLLSIMNIEPGAEVVLYDLEGMIVHKERAENTNLSMPLPHRGVYVLNVKSIGGILKEKIAW